jgi:general secretion pathway protein G
MVDQLKKHNAFTLIELLVVMSVIALLLTLATPKYFKALEKSKESALKQDLNNLREAIDNYYSDNSIYPESLDDLVKKHYIRRVPEDPITNSVSTWIVVPPDDRSQGAIFDIRSGANGQSLDGVSFSEF